MIGSRRRGGEEGGLGPGEWFGDIFRDFDETQERMERLFDQQLKDFETRTPKGLISVCDLLPTESSTTGKYRAISYLRNRSKPMLG